VKRRIAAPFATEANQGEIRSRRRSVSRMTKGEWMQAPGTHRPEMVRRGGIEPRHQLLGIEQTNKGGQRHDAVGETGNRSKPPRKLSVVSHEDLACRGNNGVVDVARISCFLRSSLDRSSHAWNDLPATVIYVHSETCGVLAHCRARAQPLLLRE
jgi:hypothetical protein